MKFLSQNASDRKKLASKQFESMFSVNEQSLLLIKDRFCILKIN